MTKAFEQKVINERIVDTKSYRYRVHEHADRFDIERIALDALDTCSAMTDWHIVKTVR